MSVLGVDVTWDFVLFWFVFVPILIGFSALIIWTYGESGTF